MASEGLSTDVLVSAAVEVSNPANTGRYEDLSDREKFRQISLDALEEHQYAEDRLARLKAQLAEQSIVIHVAQITQE